MTLPRAHVFNEMLLCTDKRQKCLSNSAAAVDDSAVRSVAPMIAAIWYAVLGHLSMLIESFHILMSTTLLIPNILSFIFELFLARACAFIGFK